MFGGVPHEGAEGGPGGAPDAEGKSDAMLTPEERAQKAKAELAAGEGASAGPGAALKAGDAKTAKGKDKAGAEKKGADGSVGGVPGKADDDLVDPDADRPDFGGTAADDEDADAEDEADDAFSSVAARAGKSAAARAKAVKRKPVDPAYVTVAIMTAAVMALGLLIWLGRSILMDVWPGIQGFYQSVGVEPKKAGDGLKIAESSKRLQRIGGIETLVVRGFISNISELPTSVPNLKLELYNEKREVIQDASANACSALLDPKASCEFEVRMELPQMAAAKGGYAIVWAK